MINVSYEPGNSTFFKRENGRYISVELDQYPDNPRHHFDNLGTFYTWSNSFISVDHCPYAGPQAFLEDVLGEATTEHLETMQDVLQALRKEGYVAKGVYRLEHGNVKYAIGDQNPFHDSWDSGAVGFAFVSPEKLLREGLSAEIAEEILRGEIEQYTAWANGDVWLVSSYDEHGEELEGGLTFYGLDEIEAEFPNLEPIDVGSENELALYAKLQQEWAFRKANGPFAHDRYQRGAVGIEVDESGDTWKIVNLVSSEVSIETFDSPLRALEAYEQYASLSRVFGDAALTSERDLRSDILAGKWRVHLVYPGDTYGRNNTVTYEKHEASRYGMGLPRVEFYDMSQDRHRFPNGQFVSSYYLSTLFGLDGWAPDVRNQDVLRLDADVPAWTIRGEALKFISGALSEVYGMLSLQQKSPSIDSDISAARAASEAARDQRDDNQKTRPGRDDQEL